MNLKDYIGKNIRITFIRGIGSNKRRIVHEGILVEISGKYCCLLNNEGNRIWINKPFIHRYKDKIECINQLRGRKRTR